MCFFFSDSALSSSDYTSVEFNMSALSSLLKKQSEQNPIASYFNVDILKYQVRINEHFLKLYVNIAFSTNVFCVRTLIYLRLHYPTMEIFWPQE